MQEERGIEIMSNKTGLEVAVIGMAGRLPGAANINEYWDNLINGVESISFFSEEELKEAGVPSELIKNPKYVNAKGILDNIDSFDYNFFGYTPAEVSYMDPQFRLLHECAWEALENAGYNSFRYNGAIGLYAGCSENLQWMARNLIGLDSDSAKYEAISLSGANFLTSRVAYKLNLQGPVVTMQTACSTSLVAIHSAIQGLLAGECDIALAGGISVTLPNKSGYMYQEGMINSPDGHCRPFDESSNGTVGGNGLGLVVLKPLEEAINDRDTIYAVIKGSAINNDGLRKVGFTSPSVKGQSDVIKQAFQVAEVEAENINYLEAHGTGTKLGDLIEIQALKNVFTGCKKNACGIGAVKSNIGHLDVSAGVAGFIKTVLVLMNKAIPPTLHFNKINHEIDLENSPFFINNKLVDLKDLEAPLRAGVSAFGIGGTNAHIILEEAPAQDTNRQKLKEGKQEKLMVLSAKSKNALDSICSNLKGYFTKNPTADLGDVTYTLQVGRRECNYRRMFTCSNIKEAIEKLSNGDEIKSSYLKDEKKQIIFMFPGQGSQYINMGLEIYNSNPYFKEEMDYCFKILKDNSGIDIKEYLYSESLIEDDEIKKKINQTEITQPILFAFEYSLAKLLMKWNIKPYAMIGHSIGEYVAAHLSGVFSLENALKLVVIRGKLMQSTSPGVMLSIRISKEDLINQMEKYYKTKLKNIKELSIAAVNSSASSVVSGIKEEILSFSEYLEEAGYESVILHTSQAFHSNMMDPILDQFLKEIKKIKLNTPKIPYISNITGNWITMEQATDPQYWVNHLRNTVQFSEGIELLLRETTSPIFVEVGPGRSLSNNVPNMNKASNVLKVNTIKHPKEQVSNLHYFYNRIGLLWLNGVEINWNEFNSNKEYYRIPLPSYPFEIHIFDSSVSQYMNAGNREFSIEKSNSHDRISLENIDDRLDKNYISSKNNVDVVLVNIAKELFGIDEISVNDDFWELGGDSLKAITFINRIHMKLNVKLSLTELFEYSKIQKISNYIQGNFENSIYNIINKSETKDYYKLSAMQKRMLILQQLDEKNIAYNLPIIVTLKGNFIKDKFERTLKDIVEHQESFRTSFHYINGEPIQNIHDNISFDIKYTENVGNMDDKIIDFIKPFDLSVPPLFRVEIVKVSKEEHVLMMDMHHIISDGSSAGIFIKEFIKLYEGDELEPLRIQYKDFSEWINSKEQQELLINQEKYWLGKFKGDIPVINLPIDYHRPVIQSFEGDHLYFSITEEETNKLKELAIKEKSTLNFVVLSIFYILLSKLSNQNDIIIGINVGGREKVQDENIIGMFVNTIALRNYLDDQKSFKEFLEGAKESSLEALENQDYQFQDLVEKLAINRDLSRNPLFDVEFVMQNMELPNIEIEDLQLETYNYENKTSKFDLSLDANEANNTLNFMFEYSTKLFKKKTIQRFELFFKKIIRTVLNDKEILLKNINIILDEDLELISRFNDNKCDLPNYKTIPELIDEHALNQPEKEAILFNGERISYLNLKEETDKLSYFLQVCNIKNDERIGLFLDRSPNIIKSILGIWKAGAAYVPIEPTIPHNRVKSIIDDAEIKIIISEKKYLNELNTLLWNCESLHAFICIDTKDIYSEVEAIDCNLKNEQFIEINNEITNNSWINGFNLQKLSEEEIDDYVNNIQEKLSKFLSKDSKVLEIGCGVSLTMVTIAPGVKEYYGVDFSNDIIEKSKKRANEQRIENIQLECITTDQIEKYSGKKFNTIIINNVSRYFLGHNYLRKVIEKAINMIEETGIIYIGDVIDQELKDILIADLKNNAMYKGSTVELFLPKAYFYDLQSNFESIEKIEFSNKIYNVENELTKYCYDVVITINKVRSVSNSRVIKKSKYQFDMSTLNYYWDSLVNKKLTNKTLLNNLAYVIYTSGSTGVPKGVMVEHIGMMNHIYAKVKDIRITADSIIAQNSSYCFDISVWQMFSSLICGGKVAYYGKDSILNADKFLKGLINDEVTILEIVPSYLSMILDYLDNNYLDFNQLAYVLVTGETVRPDFVKRWFELYPSIPLVNAYGPTEASDDITHHVMDKYTEMERVPIGKVIQNFNIYIVDNNMNLCPIGIKGEICVSGIGVGRGYLNNIQKTQEAFIIDPFIKNNTVRLYKTGDLGRFLEDGTIEFFGRKDYQVKVRGFRIELEEIQSIIISYKDIKEVVVVVNNNKGEDYLCAYIVSENNESKINVAKLKQYLSNYLPEYMIPSYFIEIDKVPLSENGKTNRKALPSPVLDLQLDSNYIEPETELERKLVKLWCEVLNMEEKIIGIDSNFFELGGNSIKVMKVINYIQIDMKVKVVLYDFFKSPTIRILAEIISAKESQKNSSIEKLGKQNYYELSYHQKKLFNVHYANAESTINKKIGRNKIKERIELKYFENAIKALVERHEILRTAFEIIDNNPVQVISDQIEIPFTFIDISSLNENEKKQKSEEIYNDEKNNMFNIENCPLFKIILIKFSENEYDLITSRHSILFDGWSLEIFRKEFWLFYNQCRSEKEEVLESLPVQYKDFASWYNKKLDSIERKERAHHYWKKQFENYIPEVSLSNKPQEILNHGSAAYNLALDNNLMGKLKKLSSENKVTTFISLFSIFNLLISDIRGQNHIPCCIVDSGRSDVALQNVLGIFYEYKLLNTYVNREDKFVEILKKVDYYVRDSIQNQDYPYELAIKELNFKMPHTDFLFNMVSMHEDLSLDDMNYARIDYIHDVHDIEFNSEITIGEFKNGLKVFWNLKKDSIDSFYIEQYLKEYCNLIKFFINNPEKSIVDYKMEQGNLS